MKTKKASGLAIAIIAMAILLLLGGIFLETDIDTKSSYYQKRDEIKGEQIFPSENYLLYINNTDIGRQKKVTESVPNLELGSMVEYDTIYIASNFQIFSNPLTKNNYKITLSTNQAENINELLVYFTPERISGKHDLLIKANGQTIAQTQAHKTDIPIRLPNIFKTQNASNQTGISSIELTFELIKPKIYQIFNWNKLEIQELKIIQAAQQKEFNKREFDFQINKEDLERAYLNTVISCQEIKELSEPIKITVNNFILTDTNPQCLSKRNLITTDIPLNIINTEKNRLTFETDGYYKIAYSINKIYYTEQDTYKFTIANFNDIIDVVMYGDFDKEAIDIRLNSQTISLNRNEIKSIIPYLRFGVNDLKILTKPIGIKELIIEKNEFIYWEWQYLNYLYSRNLYQIFRIIFSYLHNKTYL